jgi:hypothetical protein
MRGTQHGSPSETDHAKEEQAREERGPAQGEGPKGLSREEPWEGEAGPAEAREEEGGWLIAEGVERGRGKRLRPPPHGRDLGAAAPPELKHRMEETIQEAEAGTTSLRSRLEWEPLRPAVDR